MGRFYQTIMEANGVCINCGSGFRKLNNRYDRLSVISNLPKSGIKIGDVITKEWSEIKFTPKSGKRKFVCLNCVKLLGKINSSITTLMETREQFKTEQGAQHGEMWGLFKKKKKMLDALGNS